MKTFSNKVAVITGAGSGIGRYLAILLAKSGANIAACDINEAALAETVTMLRDYPAMLSMSPTKPRLKPCQNRSLLNMVKLILSSITLGSPLTQLLKTCRRTIGTG